MTLDCQGVAKKGHTIDMRLKLGILLLCIFTPQYLLAQTSNSFVSFNGDTVLKEHWSKNAGDRTSPYVLWLELQLDEQCYLPVYRTGYPTDWAFVKTIGLKSGYEGLTVAFCPKNANRCYVTEPGWLRNLTSSGFDQEESCDDNLSTEEWLE